MYPSMGTCLNYGPVLVMNYNTAPNIKGYQNGTLIWERFLKEFRL